MSYCLILFVLLLLFIINIQMTIMSFVEMVVKMILLYCILNIIFEIMNIVLLLCKNNQL